MPKPGSGWTPSNRRWPFRSMEQLYGLDTTSLSDEEACILKSNNGLRIYRASSPCSPARIRTACSTGRTKTLPSSIFSVLAALTIVSITLSEISSGTTLQRPLSEVDGVLTSTINFGMAFLTTKSLGLEQLMPSIPISEGHL